MQREMLLCVAQSKIAIRKKDLFLSLSVMTQHLQYGYRKVCFCAIFHSKLLPPSLSPVLFVFCSQALQRHVSCPRVATFHNFLCFPSSTLLNALTILWDEMP